MKTEFGNTHSNSDMKPGDIYQVLNQVIAYGVDVAPVFMKMEGGRCVCLRSGTRVINGPIEAGQTATETEPALVRYTGTLILERV